jgi:hypothetical protein
MIRGLLQKISLTRLRNLTPQEQLIYLGGAAAVLLILYLSMWLPVQRELSRLRTSVPQEKTQLAQMQVQAMEVNQLRASGRLPVAGGNLRGWNNPRPPAAFAATSRMERTDQWRTPIPGRRGFPPHRLARQSSEPGRVRVKKRFRPQATAGTVNARLVLRGAGA